MQLYPAKYGSRSKVPLSLSLTVRKKHAMGQTYHRRLFVLLLSSIQENSILISEQTGRHLAHTPPILYYINLTSSNNWVGTRDIVREADSRTVQVHLKDGARTWSKSKDKPKHPLR